MCWEINEDKTGFFEHHIMIFKRMSSEGNISMSLFSSIKFTSLSASTGFPIMSNEVFVGTKLRNSNQPYECSVERIFVPFC